jgi:hypothetical protein
MTIIHNINSFLLGGVPFKKKEYSFGDELIKELPN